MARTTTATQVRRPLSLQVEVIGAMLNFELADHPVYDSGELQWFDDDIHGTGMLAFLSRRDSRRVDYYAQRGLRIDPSGYELGGGTGSWTEVDFEVARLHVAADGVDAEARFTDIEGRTVEVRVLDRDGRPRRPAGLLAPVSAAIERPKGLLLVWMPRFDLMRAGGAPPVIRIDGVDAAIGRLPGAWLHRRHLVKYAAPVVAVQLNHSAGEPAPLDSVEQLGGVTAEADGHRARLLLQPPLPDLRSLPEGATAEGRWHVEIDGVRLTGGGWTATWKGEDARIGLDVNERWRPGRLPWLMRLVTTVIPVFRRWPTTYRWRADIDLGSPPTMRSRWERTTTGGGDVYRRATGS